MTSDRQRIGTSDLWLLREGDGTYYIDDMLSDNTIGFYTVTFVCIAIFITDSEWSISGGVASKSVARGKIPKVPHSSPSAVTHPLQYYIPPKRSAI